MNSFKPPQEINTLEQALHWIEQLRALIAALAPQGIEELCVDCQGDISNNCPPDCPVRGARAVLGWPWPAYRPAGLNG